MREIWKLAWKLLLITAIAGLALGITNELTKDVIAQQKIAEANAARIKVLPAAAEFDLIEEGQNGIDNAYAGKADGTIVGYTAQITAKGYAGDIEITVGMDMEGNITGINVGGSNFKETAGLGAKVKEPAFTDQFSGQQPPLVLKEDVQAVTGATISSRAVTNAVNTASEYLAGLMA